MRRLTIEMSLENIARFGEVVPFQKIEWLEVLHFFELNDEVAIIARVKFKDPGTRMKDLVSGQEDAVSRLELLQQEKGGIFTYFMKMKANQGATAAPDKNELMKVGGFLSTPYEFREGKARLTYLGSAGQVKRFLELVDAFGVPYKVASLEDARFSWKAPLGRLTEKQRRMLTSAYQFGYYDIPKRTSVERLAKMLHVAPSTLDVELRRGERRLLADALSEA